MDRSSWKCRVWLAGLLPAVALFCAAALALPVVLHAESCTTQSQMAAADRDGLAAAAQSFAAKVQAHDEAGVKASTIPQYAQNFDGIAAAIGNTVMKISGDTLGVTSLYLLDASGDATTKDTQFFCSLSNSASEVVFSIPALPPGRYALATVRAQSSQTAWQLSFVLEQAAGKWLLAGFIPRPATAAGHDGLWYWTQAREYAKQNQHWNAWLYYTEADALLTPVEFVSSTNRDKLHAEQTAAQPQSLQANGITAEHPLTIGSFAFTAIGVQSAQDDKSIELAVHVTATDVSDPAAVRQRGMKALDALLAAYPELRGAFPGAWIYADAPGQSSFGIEFNPLPAAPASTP